MRFVLKRLGFYLVAAWAAVTLNFILPRTMPGDPATTMFASFRGQLRPEQLESLKKAYGLSDAPLWQQYFQYLNSVFHGDFGISLSHFPEPVLGVIGTAIRWTVLLGVVSLLLSFLIGTTLGAIGAWRRGKTLDSVMPPVMMFIGSFPHFFLALIILFVLGLTLNWFPHNHAYDDFITPSLSLGFVGSVLYHLVLPAGTIVIVAIASWMIRTRNTMIGVLAEDYLMVAEAKGLSQARILIRYAARNAMLPNITAFGMDLGFILSGQLLTEIVFSYPGLGYQLLQAVTSLDYPLMQALFLMITVTVLVANLIVDMLYVRLDPRARTS
jgi:peptide/nickel transport system permease protein